MTTFNIFHTTRVRIGVRDAPHIWGAGEIRDAGERRLFGGLARSEPFVTPHVWGTGEMSTEISATYLGRCGNKHWKSRRIYVALGHDELNSIDNWLCIVSRNREHNTELWHLSSDCWMYYISCWEVTIQGKHDTGNGCTCTGINNIWNWDHKHMHTRQSYRYGQWW